MKTTSAKSIGDEWSEFGLDCRHERTQSLLHKAHILG